MSVPIPGVKVHENTRIVYGVWRVDTLYTDPAYTLLVSHITPLNTFLGRFASQATRIDALAPGTSTHLCDVFLSALVRDQDTWVLLNELMVNDLAQKQKRHGSQSQPWVLGRLTLVVDNGRVYGGGREEGSGWGAQELVPSSDDNGANRGEAGDPRDQLIAGPVDVAGVHGVWRVYNDIGVQSIQASKGIQNTNIDSIATTIPGPMHLISHITPLVNFVAHYDIAVRIDILASRASVHFREVFLSALISDQDTWAMFNSLMINDLTRGGESGPQPWILGRLVLPRYYHRSGGVPHIVTGLSSVADTKVDHEAVGPAHATELPPRPTSPTILVPYAGNYGAETGTPVSPLERTILGENDQGSVLSPVLDKTGLNTTVKVQEYCKVAMGALGGADIDLEKARAAIRAAIALLGEERI